MKYQTMTTVRGPVTTGEVLRIMQDGKLWRTYKIGVKIGVPVDIYSSGYMYKAFMEQY